MIKFELHQCYEEPEDTEQYLCEKCGHDKFYIGLGHCYTVVKCANCEHEECVHEG